MPAEDLNPLQEIPAPTEEQETDRAVRPGEQLRILVIDDEPEVLEIFAAMLRRRSWEVVCAASAMEGIEAWSRDDFNLILMDVQMPDVTGLEAARTIRSRERSGNRPYTPIVALTAWTHSEFRRACRAAGMDDFIAKPIGMTALWAAVERNARRESSH
jgi:CheY-like chemotaxis protein